MPTDFLPKAPETEGTPTPMLPPAFLVHETLDQVYPWERCVDEDESSWERFKAFRDSPRPRKVVRPGAGRTQDLYDLAGRWRWFERVAAYDRHMDRVHQAVVEGYIKQDAKEVAMEHMAILRDARELVSIEYDRLLRRAKDCAIDGVIRPTDLIRLTEVMIKYDRLVRGEATQNVQTVGDLSEMSIEELREAQALAKKMNAPRLTLVK